MKTKIAITELQDLARKILIEKFNYTDKEAETILKVLMYAQLRGSNQGVVKLIGNGLPKNPEASEPKTIKETPVSALVNGNHTNGMVVMDSLCDIAIEKAKKSGIGIAGNFNTGESTGALGYYVQKIAEQNLIGIAFASAPFKTTAPFGSIEAMFCTNPFAYGVPTEGDPIILDMSTSAIAYYGLIEAKTAGRKLPEGLGYDSTGAETTDPAEIMDGAIKTFGGHKGSGLALIVQIFAGSLVQADSFDDDSDNSGNLVIAIDPNILTSADDFKKENSRIVGAIKGAKKLDGVDEIFVSGEQSNKTLKMNMEAGEVEVEERLLEELRKAGS